jgi:Rieske Fe-S protein
MACVGPIRRYPGMSDQAVHRGLGAETPRRDFLLLVAGALGGVGLVSALWPFVDTLEPAEDTIAAGGPRGIVQAAGQPGQH